MSGWLLDTNVLSELRRPLPEQRVVAFVAAQPLASLFVSTVTLAALRYGVERVKDTARRRIAATAQLHGMTVVSRDRTEYERARVPVLSPWAEA